MNPRVAVYLRVSTGQQCHDSQRADLNEYCQRRGWTDTLWFEDTASGSKTDREGLKQLMERVRRGKIDIVLVFKLDRLARSLSHLAQILAELQTHKVALVCPSQGIDTTNGSPCAQFQLNILAAVAQFERELIRERVNAGLSAARLRGIKLGRPAKRYKQAEQVKALVQQGLSTVDISRKLGIPYSTTGEIVREIRKNLSEDSTQ